MTRWILVLALLACGGGSETPSLAGQWNVTLAMYDGTNCDGSMNLSGPNESLSGPLAMNAPCPSGLNGTLSLTAMPQGTVSGQLARLDTYTSTVYAGTWSAKAMVFSLGNEPDPVANRIGTYRASR